MLTTWLRSPNKKMQKQPRPIPLTTSLRVGRKATTPQSHKLPQLQRRRVGVEASQKVPRSLQYGMSRACWILWMLFTQLGGICGSG
jgi:hypothetical protein